MESRERAYKATGDPFRAWEAYFLVHHYGPAGLEMPEWVAAYMERVSRRMIQISRAEPTGDDLLATIATALEITGSRRRGRGAVFTRRKQRRTAEQLALDVAVLITRGYKPYQAMEEVAKIHRVSASAVGRAYRAVWREGEQLGVAGWEGPPTPTAGLPE
jgi:hypothetical protein